jgi:hypothetical protein
MVFWIVTPYSFVLNTDVLEEHAYSIFGVEYFTTFRTEHFREHATPSVGAE